MPNGSTGLLISHNNKIFFTQVSDLGMDMK